MLEFPAATALTKDLTISFITSKFDKFHLSMHLIESHEQNVLASVRSCKQDRKGHACGGGRGGGGEGAGGGGLTLDLAILGGQLVLQLSGQIWLAGSRQSILQVCVATARGVEVQPQCLQFVQLQLHSGRPHISLASMQRRRSASASRMEAGHPGMRHVLRDLGT